MPASTTTCRRMSDPPEHPLDVLLVSDPGRRPAPAFDASLLALELSAEGLQPSPTSAVDAPSAIRQVAPSVIMAVETGPGAVVPAAAEQADLRAIALLGCRLSDQDLGLLGTWDGLPLLCAVDPADRPAAG